MIPVDLITSSGSGLDPHISIAAASYQMKRVAAARNMSENAILALIDSCTEQRQWGILGEPGVNVLKLNLKLDEAKI
jgi:K+-transporting ATPase ATPase C chain